MIVFSNVYHNPTVAQTILNRNVGSRPQQVRPTTLWKRYAQARHYHLRADRWHSHTYHDAALADYPCRDRGRID